MSTIRIIARQLAAAYLAGAWSVDEMTDRGLQACGKGKRWIKALARSVLERFPDPPRDARILVAFIASDAGFLAAWSRHWLKDRVPLRRSILTPASMKPLPGAPSTWAVPTIPTPGRLAEWLALTPKELDWFADCQGRESKVPPGPLRHYTYRWLAQRSGKFRLLEMPKQRLKAIQRRILHEILERIPPHDAVHSYRRGRSIATYVAPHAGQQIVLRFDLRNFFPSIRRSRVHALFRTAGYPAAVARILTGLCTNVVPPDVSDAHPQATVHDVYRSAHLPQGAPTSPALANLCAYRLDCRLSGLVRKLNARYTRYADDLAFSGDTELERSARRFQVCVCRLALEEGFEVHTRKSRFMRQGVRQQLCGVVLNAHPNICREEYDRLRAILTNCIRHGSASQNRDGHADFGAHLLGRIAYVDMLNQPRGRRLQVLFERIRWDGGR